jgi:AraC-like DNA-binding protein
MWQSPGGPGAGHPARSLFPTLTVPVPERQETLQSVTVLGVFALWSDPELEPPGSIGAIAALQSNPDVVCTVDLVADRHYSDALDTAARRQSFGDGSSVETVGVVEIDGRPMRLDELRIDVPEGSHPVSFVFCDRGTPASFLIFDVEFGFRPLRGCPFHSRTGGVPLSEVASIVRVGDRVRLQAALDQLESGVLATENLDEARGEALTFLAQVTAATLEMGGPRSMHRVLLDSARAFDRIGDQKTLAAEARRIVCEIAAPMLAEASSPSERLMDSVLAMIDRNFARALSDETIAQTLGLSRSHFRYLFRKATGQPFHKYVLALRLERARELLTTGQMSVTDVAAAVGFTGLSHFSRVFSQRFGVSPSAIRRGSA